MSCILFRRVHAGLAALAILTSSAASGAESESGRFARSVVNLESFRGSLMPKAPASVRRAPVLSAKDGMPILFGEIYRQLPGDLPTSREHNVPFAVRLEAGVAVQAWADANLDGDLTNDPAPELAPYPREPSSRSFLIALRWSARVAEREVPLERLVRIVVEEPSEKGTAPDYRIQDVYGMLGQVEIGGATRRALLYDANQDGLYTRGLGDGVFLDLDDDRHFVIDPMRPDFGPFTIPFTALGRSLEVDSVAWNGSWMALRDHGPARAAEPPSRGRPAPDFSFVDMEGRPQRLSAHRGRPTVVYFWASWCASCRGQAHELRELLERDGGGNWDLLGIGCDTDRAAALRFRQDFGITWPTSFSGGFTTEDPVARLYREPLVGVFYVVGPDGVLADKVTDVPALEAALDALAEARPPTAASGR